MTYNISENQIYSFGNGESGRLGAVFEQGKGPNGQCTARPRAIFGSLHLVASISCGHWNTLLIAGELHFSIRPLVLFVHFFICLFHFIIYIVY